MYEWYIVSEYLHSEKVPRHSRNFKLVVIISKLNGHQLANSQTNFKVILVWDLLGWNSCVAGSYLFYKSKESLFWRDTREWQLVRRCYDAMELWFEWRKMAFSGKGWSPRYGFEYHDVQEGARTVHLSLLICLLCDYGSSPLLRLEVTWHMQLLYNHHVGIKMSQQECAVHSSSNMWSDKQGINKIIMTMGRQQALFHLLLSSNRRTCYDQNKSGKTLTTNETYARQSTYDNDWNWWRQTTTR